MIPEIQSDSDHKKLTFIDLFSGCGGFTLGMLRAGFDCMAAIDSNAQAVATLRTNLQDKTPTGLPPVGYVLEVDLTTLQPGILAAIIGPDVPTPITPSVKRPRSLGAGIAVWSCLLIN